MMRNTGTNLEDFAKKSRGLSLDTFLKRYDDHFLVVRGSDQEETTRFRTGEIDVSSAKKSDSESKSHGQIFPLKKTQNAFQNMISLGRTSNNDIVLHHAFVSKLHAFFRPRPDGSGYTITDLGSSYGTKIDGAPLVPNVAVPVENGQVLTFGRKVRSTFLSAKGLYEYIQSLRFFKKL